MIHKRHRKSHPNHSATHTTLSHHITSPRKGHPCRPPHPTHISPKLFPCLPPFVSTFSSRLELSFRQRRVHQQPEVQKSEPRLHLRPFPWPCGVRRRPIAPEWVPLPTAELKRRTGTARQVHLTSSIYCPARGAPSRTATGWGRSQTLRDR